MGAQILSADPSFWGLDDKVEDSKSTTGSIQYEQNCLPVFSHAFIDVGRYDPLPSQVTVWVGRTPDELEEWFVDKKILSEVWGGLIGRQKKKNGPVFVVRFYLFYVFGIANLHRISSQKCLLMLQTGSAMKVSTSLSSYYTAINAQTVNINWTFASYTTGQKIKTLKHLRHGR